MLKQIINHKIRKELIKKNKKFNHNQFLQSLLWGPKIKYWSGYHKKKLIFFGLCLLITWNYDLHHSLYYKILQIRSPKQVLSHLIFGSQKIQKTINEQKIVGWSFPSAHLQVLAKLFHVADKQLIFGVGRNYLFQTYSTMGLLQKQEDIKNFWVASGFFRKRNQQVSGVSYKQFIVLFQQGYKSLKKIKPQLTQQQYFDQFVNKFIKKAPQISKWQKQFNKKRHGQYLKTLVADSQQKFDQINTIMKQNLQINQNELENKLKNLGLKGMGLRDKWLYWTNREVLYSLKQLSIHKQINLNIIEFRQRQQLQKKLKEVQNELKIITSKKQKLKNTYLQLYQQQIA